MPKITDIFILNELSHDILFDDICQTYNMIVSQQQIMKRPNCSTTEKNYKTFIMIQMKIALSELVFFLRFEFLARFCRKPDCDVIQHGERAWLAYGKISSGIHKYVAYRMHKHNTITQARTSRARR